jgi:peptidoglycan/LPS O-acetylase OafA/YrhL
MVPEIINCRNRLYAEVTHIPQVLQKKHLPSLDGLRCFSILYVIIGHVNEYNPAGNNEYLTYFLGGVFGVQFFFVISGFLITTLLLTEKIRTGTISLRHFYLRRLLRILPVAWLFLIVLILLNRYFDLGIARSDLLKGFFFVKNIGHQNDWHTAHYWSLSVEEQYYLIFPFILSWGGMKTYLNVCFLFIGLYIVKNIFEHFYPSGHEPLYAVLNIFLNSNLLSILTGSLASIFLFKYDIGLPRMNNVLLAIIQALLFVLAFLTFKYPKFFGLTSLMSSCSIAAGILLFIKFPFGVFHAILNNRIIAYIGRLSFSLYIWQQLFTAHQPWSGYFIYGNSIILNLVFLGIVAFLSYNYFEKPFLKLKGRFK